MELFIPGLILLVVSAFFVFMILPRIGPAVLVGVALFAIFAAGIHHYSMFSSEYRLSTWQYGLAAYTPFVILGLAFIIILGTLTYIFGGSEVRSSMRAAIPTPMAAAQESVFSSYSNMPSAASATNPVTSAINSLIPKSNNKSPPINGLGYSASSV